MVGLIHKLAAGDNDKSGLVMWTHVIASQW